MWTIPQIEHWKTTGCYVLTSWKTDSTLYTWYTISNTVHSFKKFSTDSLVELACVAVKVLKQKLFVFRAQSISTFFPAHLDSSDSRTDFLQSIKKQNFSGSQMKQRQMSPIKGNFQNEVSSWKQQLKMEMFINSTAKWHLKRKFCSLSAAETLRQIIVEHFMHLNIKAGISTSWKRKIYICAWNIQYATYTPPTRTEENHRHETSLSTESTTKYCSERTLLTLSKEKEKKRNTPHIHNNVFSYANLNYKLFTIKTKARIGVLPFPSIWGSYLLFYEEVTVECDTVLFSGN